MVIVRVIVFKYFIVLVFVGVVILKKILFKINKIKSNGGIIVVSIFV